MTAAVIDALRPNRTVVNMARCPAVDEAAVA
jgi:phosphoglycerate dehydrogenase-like enzyme